MAISDADCKILWGRAAGRCSNPQCRVDLTADLHDLRSLNVGEMAHIIARRPGGPRGHETSGPDAYGNLILLCPTCHRRIDKAPEEYPEELLRRWKELHENEVRALGKERRFDSLQALKEEVSCLLAENHELWRTLGPQSDTAKSDPDSNLNTVWELRKLDTIVPNNHRIINMIQANRNLLSSNEYRSFLKFKNHATAFEKHQYDRLDVYPRFPAAFEENFRR